MIQLDCPRCGSELQLPDRRAGGVIRCPECEERLRVPSPGPQAPDVAAEAPSPVVARGASTFGRGLVAMLAVLPVGVALAVFYPTRSGPQQPQATSPVAVQAPLPAPISDSPEPAAIAPETESTPVLDTAEGSR
jgi:hypothetical protein